MKKEKDPEKKGELQKLFNRMVNIRQRIPKGQTKMDNP